MNDQNLIPFNQRTESEQRAITRKGGIASGKARLRKKHGRELMQALLSMREPDPRIIAELESLGIDAKEITKEVAMQARQIEKAIRKADTNAFNAVNKAAGYTEEAPAGNNVSVNIVVRSQEEADKIRNIGSIG